MNELDPHFTGVIQISSIQNYYSEEIAFFKTVSLSRPKEIFDVIRTKAFQVKRIALQQSLMATDYSGDGYIDQDGFINAFYLAKVDIERENLEFLFDAMSERFVRGAKFEQKGKVPLSRAEQDFNDEAEKKYLNLYFFFGKLFQQFERREVTEVDETLSIIKASLIYKGVDFSVVFAEQAEEIDTMGNKKSRVTTDEKIDMMSHYTTFVQQLSK